MGIGTNKTGPERRVGERGDREAESYFSRCPLGSTRVDRIKRSEREPEITERSREVGTPITSRALFILGLEICAQWKACVHASAYLAFIVLSFWALVTYLAVNLWLRGYGYQSKDTL